MVRNIIDAFSQEKCLCIFLVEYAVFREVNISRECLRKRKRLVQLQAIRKLPVVR